MQKIPSLPVLETQNNTTLVSSFFDDCDEVSQSITDGKLHEFDALCANFPATVTSGRSCYEADSFVRCSEKFSSKYAGRISRGLLYQLALAFKQLNGHSKSEFKRFNRCLDFFCEFAEKKKLTSLSQLNGLTLLEFLNFLKQKYPVKNTWRDLYRSFKKIIQNYLPDDVFWPVNYQPQNRDTTTPGISPQAFSDLICCLVKEIDRIRQKIGRYDESMSLGRVLSLEDIQSYSSGSSCPLSSQQLNSIKNRLSETSILSAQQINELAEYLGIRKANLYSYIRRIKEGNPPKTVPDYNNLSIHDVLATIRYYLPDWPISGSPLSEYDKGSWRVYERPRGIFIKEFHDLHEAEMHVKKCGGVILGSLKRGQLDLMNPGEILLAHLHTSTIKSGTTRIMRHLASIVGRVSDLIERYFPTSYDSTCILLYWLSVTGWNLEAIHSVKAMDIGLGTDITRKNTMELFSNEHFIIEGITGSRNNKMATQDQIEDPFVYFEGMKFRSQPADCPKIFTNISDKNYKYDLYPILSDFFKLTIPLRVSLLKDENNCILLGVNPGGASGSSRNITIFGNCMSSIRDPVNDSKNCTWVRSFFKQHKIEEKFGDGGSKRITGISSKVIRTSFESWLKHIGLPLEERQIVMGHNSIQTTLTSYGAEKISRGIRRELLRKDLVSVANRAFQGELERYEQQLPNERAAIIQLYEHRGTPVMFCNVVVDPDLARFMCFSFLAPRNIVHKKTEPLSFCCNGERVRRGLFPADRCCRWLNIRCFRR